jgi:hypothetical protein
VDICPVELGRRAAELLLSAIKNPVKRGFETQWIETKLIERGSVRRIESSAPPVRKDEVENLDRAPLREQIASSSVYPSN